MHSCPQSPAPRAVRKHATPLKPLTTVLEIPKSANEFQAKLRGKTVHLTNLQKPFWPDGHTKGDILRYYAEVSTHLLPHLCERAMVMKRYPNGIEGAFFFMKRTPSPKPEWLVTCAIEHASGNVIDFPVIQDLASLLWVVNLGCIDLNPWYARCDDVHRPDYLHFDLDPTPGATLDHVRRAALAVRDALDKLGMPSYAKTSGSRGVHVYVPIIRGPLQKQVWTFAKQFARDAAEAHPDLLTAEYRIAKRPPERVLADYNQNAWGRTLASVYSIRPKPRAPVSAPLTWDEVERGFEMEQFNIDSMSERLHLVDDLWKPMIGKRGRVQLEKFL